MSITVKKTKRARIMNDITFKGFSGSGNPIQKLFKRSDVRFTPHRHGKGRSGVFGVSFSSTKYFQLLAVCRTIGLTSINTTEKNVNLCANNVLISNADQFSSLLGMSL